MSDSKKLVEWAFLCNGEIVRTKVCDMDEASRIGLIIYLEDKEKHGKSDVVWGYLWAIQEHLKLKKST